MAKIKQEQPFDVFTEFKERLLNVDPVYFVEQNLTVDGKPLKISGNGWQPFAEIYRYMAIKAVEPTGKPVVLCKGRQVGASLMCAALTCALLCSDMYGNNGRPPMRIMHVFPTLGLAAAYSKDKLDPIITSAKPMPGALKKNGLLKSVIENKVDNSSPANFSMHFKKFVGGNQIWVDSCGADGDRIRGRTVDVLFMDEIQDISTLAVGAVTKILTQAQYGPIGKGTQLYFGTPKQKNSSFHRMWLQSSQQYYHLGCEACEQYFPLYRPDVNWEEIWLYGFIVKCTHCGHEQDKRDAAERGKWIPYNTSENLDFIGYHINQLYIPQFSKETVLSQKPERNPANTEKIYQNEVLGEFYDGEGATITQDEIIQCCGDLERGYRTTITRDEGRRVYAGFDWGQRGDWDQMAGKQRGQSYSCVVVITAQGPKIWNIEFATRMMKTDPKSKEEVVDEIFRRYGVHLAVGDIGDAYDLTHTLQKKYYERFLASRAVPKINGHVKYDRDIFPREIKFERDYYISELMGLLKDGNIRFPLKSYDRLAWLIHHCCSMEIKITYNRSGDPVRRFIKGPTPNDGAMALLNAYLAWKFDVTQQFKIARPEFMKYDVPLKHRKIPAILGVIPRWK